MKDGILPLGKLPAPLLERLLAQAPVDDPDVLVGPGIGLDCAVVEAGDELLVLKSDPITFVTTEPGRYLVQVNANDIATTGATPRWLLLTLLLPEGDTTEASAERLMREVFAACQELDISLVGGHTEISHGLDRPIAMGALIGTVKRDKLITPRGARAGDRILLTKTVPIEGTSILAREFPDQLRSVLSEAELCEAQNYLYEPGIGITRDAQVARGAGTVTAMHDPTEGGLVAALWELAHASGHAVHVDLRRVPVSRLSATICHAFGVNPMETIASGVLLLTVPADETAKVCQALGQGGIPCTDIGEVREGPAALYSQTETGEVPLAWPRQDGIALVFARRA